MASKKLEGNVKNSLKAKAFIFSKYRDQNSKDIKTDNSSNEMVNHTPVQDLHDNLLEMCRCPSASSLHLINDSRKVFLENCLTIPDAAYKLMYEFLKKVVDQVKCTVDKEKKSTKHVMNSIPIKTTQESMEDVASWRIIYSFSIWSEFLGKRKDTECLKIVVDILLRIVQSNFSMTFIPFRLFCSRILIQISRDSGLFIPTLPIIVEPLQLQLFQKESKQTDWKCCLFSLCLKMSRSELIEKAFIDSMIDEIAELLLTYSSLYSHSIAFPELVLPAIVVLKEFTQKCTDKNHVKKMKQVLDKIQAHYKFIEKKRRMEVVDLKDVNAVNSLEIVLATEQNELKTFFGNWMKNREKQLELQLEEEKEAEKLAGEKLEMERVADNSEDEEMEFEEASDEEDLEEEQ